MKYLFTFAMGFVFSIAQAKADCDLQVTQEYQKYVEEETPNEFDGVWAISHAYAKEAIEKSQEMDEETQAEALSKIAQPQVLLYEGMSNYMSGTGLEILLVDANTCKIQEKFFYYAE